MKRTIHRLRAASWAAVLITACLTSAACDSPSMTTPDAATDDAATDAPAPSGLQGIEAYLKASNTGAGDLFADDVAISGDGLTVAVGARRESSSATGIDGDQTNDAAIEAGAVYLYVRTGTTWTQQAYIKPSDTHDSDHFGQAVSLSHDGNTLVVSARDESSCATGVDADGSDNNCGAAGAAYVFTRTGTTWSQQAYLKASNTAGSAYFGEAVAISADASTIVVGAPGDASPGRGVNAPQTGNTATLSGAAFVFVRSGSTWTQQAYLKSSNSDPYDTFGVAISLSSDGNVLAVGAAAEQSGATGVNGSQLDNGTSYAGAVYVFRRTNSTWTQSAYIKASNTDSDDVFGRPLALSPDGSTLAVGANGESSNATGVNGNQADDSELMAGAVYVFTFASSQWTQQAYLKSRHAANAGNFGQGLAVSGTGDVIAVGAIGDDSGGTGITTPSGRVNDSGAVELFERTGTTWAPTLFIKASNTGESDIFGRGLAMDASATTLAIGASGEDSAATGIGGDASDNTAINSGAAYIVR